MIVKIIKGLGEKMDAQNEKMDLIPKELINVKNNGTDEECNN